MQHAEADAAAQSDAERQRYLKAAKLRAIERLLWGSFDTASEQAPRAPWQGRWLWPRISTLLCPGSPACLHVEAMPPSSDPKP